MFPRIGRAMQRDDVINNADCVPWGLCRVLIGEVNSEARSSWEYKDENGACPWWIVKISWVQIRTEEYTVIVDKNTWQWFGDSFYVEIRC
jgi:hypothetical protein